MNEKTFIKNFEDTVERTIREWDLVEKNDKVLVACSGGKDSTTVLYLLKKFGYDVEGLTIDLLMGDYSKKCLSTVRSFCNQNSVKLHEISIREEFGCSVCYMKSVLDSRGHAFRSCKICGTLKRDILNRKARGLKATKLATGHNLDDEAQTIFMNFIQGNISLSAKLGPVTGQIMDRKFVPRIKPLYFCLERDIRKYSELKNFPVIYDRCPCSVDSFRSMVKENLNELEKSKPNIKMGIVEGVIKILPVLRKHYKTSGSLKYCRICNEPSRKDICSKCEMLRLLKK